MGPDKELNIEGSGVSSSSSEVRIKPKTPVVAGAETGLDRPDGPGWMEESRRGIFTGDKMGLESKDPKSPYRSSTSKSAAKEGLGQGAIELPVESVDGRLAEATKE